MTSKIPNDQVRLDTLRSATRVASILVTMVAAPVFASADFDRDIEPILTDRCYSCHGPDKHKGGLRLDRKSDARMTAASPAARVRATLC